MSFPQTRESSSWDASHATVPGFLLNAGMTESGQRLVTLREVATTVMHPRNIWLIRFLRASHAWLVTRGRLPGSRITGHQSHLHAVGPKRRMPGGGGQSPHGKGK